jgi:hypothetical protein
MHNMDVSTVSISKIQSELQLIKAQLAELLTAKPEAWLTTQQVCERYHLSLRTVANYRRGKRVPYHMVGRKLLYKQSDWENFFSSHAIRKQK